MLNIAQLGLNAYYFSNQGGGVSLPQELQNLFSVLWLGTVSGNELVDVKSGQNFTITNKDFAGSTIPSTSSATLALPDVAALKVDDDWDAAWYNDSGVANQVPVGYLINNNYSRTLVKYANASPYDVEWIGILDDAANPTSEQWDQLHEYFQLDPYWSGVLNNNGVVKENRPLAGVQYKGWITQCETTLGFVGLTTATKKSINKYILYKRNMGLWDLRDRQFLWMLNDPGDGSINTTYGTVPLKNYTATRGAFTGTVTHQASGFFGDGSTGYFDSFYNPSTQGVLFTQNNASFSLYVYKNKTLTTSYMMGYASFATSVLTNGSSTTLQRINANANIGSGVSLSIGYAAADRSAASGVGSVSIYNELTKLDYDVVSVAPSNGRLLVGRATFGYGDDGHSMFNVGASLSQTEHEYEMRAILDHKTRLAL